MARHFLGMFPVFIDGAGMETEKRARDPSFHPDGLLDSELGLSRGNRRKIRATVWGLGGKNQCPEVLWLIHPHCARSVENPFPPRASRRCRGSRCASTVQ